MVILNGYFTDRGSVGRCQCRNETVHFAIERQLSEQVAPVRLEGCPKVVDVDSAELGHQPIGTSGRDLPQQQIVDAVAAPPTHDVVALFDLCQKDWDLCWIMLKIAIHSDHIFASAVRESSSERCGLAEVSTQPNGDYMRVDFGEFLQQLVSEILAAIIDKDELVTATELLHDTLQTAIEFNDVRFLVMKRNNNRNRGGCLDIRHAVPPF